ncbi:MAG TPA: selenium metabolism-associated LysR family transcriptional regulator [archaeon]|nr:selenium metabolism-associated LysR family transcriptional regulator [archaeon]
MDLRALEVFCKIIELRSFSRAAEAVLLTQPTVSGHIKALETEVGLRLLDRSAKTVTPTRAGEILYGYARRILTLREEARQAINEHKGGLKGHLALGASNIPGAYILPPVVAAFKREHPDVTISLHISGSRDIARRVTDGTCEVGMVGARFEGGRLHYEPFAEDELVLVVPSAHPWAGRSTVRPSDLATQPFILRERGSGTRKTMEEALSAHDVDPAGLRVVLEVSGNEAVRQALKAGVGISILSRRAVEDEIRHKMLAALRILGVKMVREFFLVTHKSRSHSPLAKAFVSFLEQSAGTAP